MSLVLDGHTGNSHRDPPSTATIRVVVVDDQQAFRDAAAAVVDASEGFELVANLADTTTLSGVLAALQPDLLLLDVRMPDADGADVACRVMAEHPQMAVLLMSVYSSTEIPEGVLTDRVRFVEKENLTTDTLTRMRGLLHRREAGEP